MAGTVAQPAEILLIEDNPGDVDLTMEALKESKIHNHVSVVSDGVEALAFLRQQEPYYNSPRPDLILLDLNLPKKDGRELLMEIKADEVLKRIPVVVLTTSDEEKDVLIMYNRYVNCYIKKPIDPDEFMDVIKTIENFWVSIVTLPRR